jgi:signal transduction histidine kinase
MEGCLLILLGIFTIVLFASYPAPALIITAILTTVGIIIYQSKKADEKERERFKKEAAERAMQAYNDLKAKAKIPNSALKVSYKGGINELATSNQYVWIDNNYLCFFPADPPDTDEPSKYGR